MKGINRRKTAIGLCLLIAFVAWPLYQLARPVSIAESHELTWRDARNKIREQAYDNSPSSGWDYLRPRTWLWYWQGKPDREEVWRLFLDHEKELVRLGVFATETVFLTNHVYHEAMTNRASFLNGPHGIESADSSGISLVGPQEFLISGKAAWVRAIGASFRKWDSLEPDQPQ